MRKLLTLIVSFAIITLSGCSISETSTASDFSTLEGTNVPAYLIGEYVDVATAKEKLKNAGFEVLATYKPVRNGRTIVFTNEALKKEAAKPGHAYAAVVRLFIDAQEKKISFTNPIYFGKAFMQEKYNHEVFSGVVEAITKAFDGLKPSKDALAFDKLAKYQFMIGLPDYEDVILLGSKNATTADAIAKAKRYKHGKAILFELRLSQKSTLLGYDLGRRTKRFVKKIGRANAAILPYTVAIENGQAAALNPKYYIALSYPLLDMAGFMGIATVPGAIKKDLAKAFKN